MSFTSIAAICILGCDIAIYVLFKRIYGEKHGRRVRRLDMRISGLTLRKTQSYYAASANYTFESDRHAKAGERTPSELNLHGGRVRELAY